MAGSKIGEVVHEGGKVIVKCASNIVTTAWQGMKEAVKAIGRAVNPLYWLAQSLSATEKRTVMSVYRSCGTIRLSIHSSGSEIVFTPDGDHQVKHDGKSYAVFLKENENRVVEDTSRKIPLDNFKDSAWAPLVENAAVKISLDNFKDSALVAAVASAALAQVKVEVEVEEQEAKAEEQKDEVEEQDGNSGRSPTMVLTLVGITVPAK